MNTMKFLRTIAFGALAFAGAAAAHAQALPADVSAKVQAKMKDLRHLSTDAAVVSAVKAYNANPPAAAKSMTNEQWKQLTLLDPNVRALTKNELGQYLKSKQDDVISEAFVSGANGGKVAFLSKTTSWTHKGKPKHEVPMTGQTWIGPMEVDESSGQQQVQIALPVLDGGRAIGSIVIGLKVSKLRS